MPLKSKMADGRRLIKIIHCYISNRLADIDEMLYVDAY